MPEQRGLTQHGPQAQAIVDGTDSPYKSPDVSLTYRPWATTPKRTIADIVDDQVALADWRRNLARLRANWADDPT